MPNDSSSAGTRQDVSSEEFSRNWEETFGKKERCKTCNGFGVVIKLSPSREAVKCPECDGVRRED